ncbi:DUF4276 family protein [Plesiocystis pacifica]|uniref:DUF4276 family protein n=1 Tax=Plesiocystis pacifica TaxID=191768 RepID=UPI000A3128FF|nr:DUF4276 family protein [Plesiocystis pacifica]
MKLSFVFIGEGPTDALLTPHLERLCLEADPRVIEVRGTHIDFSSIPGAPGRRLVDQLSWVREHASRADIVFIHRDADSRDAEPVRQRIAKAVSTAGIEAKWVAVVPVQELEAWLLVDEAAIRLAVANPRGKASLDLPKPKHVEMRANPKEALKKAIVVAGKSGRAAANFAEARRRLLERIDIHGPVSQLPAWRRLVDDVGAVVTELLRERGE